MTDIHEGDPELRCRMRVCAHTVMTVPNSTTPVTRPDASHPRRIGKRPGPKPTFSLSDAVRAALALGIDRFTMGGVARELGVAPSALYRVVPDRDALIREALASIITHHTAPSHDQPWQDQLRELADGTWELLDQHPGLAAVALTTPQAEDAATGFLAGVVEGLVGAGLEPSDALFAVDFVVDTVMVSHLGYSARVDAEQAAGEPGHTDAADAVTPQDLSARAAALATGTEASEVFVPERIATTRSWLARKIELIIGGIEAGLAR